MGDYAALTELQTWVGVADSYDDDTLTAALASAERGVNAYCGRVFTLASSATARRFHAYDSYTLALPAGHDISSTAGLVVKTDDNDDGTAETTWTITTDFELDPPGGVGVDGSTGWPYREVYAVGSRCFPTVSRRPLVEITAAWGWATVPEPVKHATLITAAEIAKLKDAPFGVAGFGDLGLIRVRENPKVAQLLNEFRHPYHAAVIA